MMTKKEKIIDYYNSTKDFWLINLASQLKNPTLIRIDINVPVIDGRIVEDNLRLFVYADILSLLSEYAGLVVVAHQGRKGQHDFISLKQHWIILRKLLPPDIDIEYIPFKDMYKDKLKKKIKKLKRKEILLLDNIRMDDEETNFNSSSSRFISFFKGLINSCVNDAIPVWHRAHTSLMALPYIAETYIGLRAIYELKAIREALLAKKSEAGIIMGGAKLAKSNYLINILRRMEGYTGGLPGQLIARVKGYDLGERNNRFLNKKLTSEMFEAAKLLVKKFKVYHPVDFVVWENGEDKILKIDELKNSDGTIMDIGPETVDLYANLLEGKELRIRAGPLGVYEKGYINGINLTKRIAGSGLIFLGGDTTAELMMHNLDRVIQNSGGIICISGGAFLHGLAGERYPCIDIMLNKEKIKYIGGST